MTDAIAYRLQDDYSPTIGAFTDREAFLLAEVLQETPETHSARSLLRPWFMWADHQFSQYPLQA